MIITAKFNGKCKVCGKPVVAGESRVQWEPGVKGVTCVGHVGVKKALVPAMATADELPPDDEEACPVGDYAMVGFPTIEEGDDTPY